MSTFNGFVKEFPTIRIDRFRKISGKPHPVVGLISHIHSDHLQGLESWGKIPLYCSPTTRKLLLHIERYPQRTNFANGILECRKRQYKTLRDILRPIPLSAPTDIEVEFGHSIRVTLFDANHCAGAVMFLIEDKQKAILYTGDIRSETWWVNSLVRNPACIPYASGFKRLDNIYLDTTYATKEKQFRSFPPKATGIKELLEKISEFPKETVFHLNTWTFGYEDVWIALSSALNTRVHVDDYQHTLYGSLASDSTSHFECPEGPPLIGFTNGNHLQKGCLTNDITARLHSCERGTDCPVLSSPRTVFITPIIKRDEDGEIYPEIGAGNAVHESFHTHVLEELNDSLSTDTLLEFCDERGYCPALRSKIQDMISRASERDEQRPSLSRIALQDLKSDLETVEIVRALIERTSPYQKDFFAYGNKTSMNNRNKCSDALPRRLEFSYSRHSSYEELCNLIATFKPRDIYPCTINWQEWSWTSSIENLFGRLSDMVLAHDQEMADMHAQVAAEQAHKRPRSPSDSWQHSIPREEVRQSQNLASSREEDNRFCRRRISTRSDHRPREVDLAQRIGNLRQMFEQPFEFVNAQTEPNRPLSGVQIAGSGNSAFKYTLRCPRPHREDVQPHDLLPYQSISTDKRLNTSMNKSTEAFEDIKQARFDSQAEGNFLLEEMPAPEDVSSSEKEQTVEEHTQLTLSDSYFESQSFGILPEKHATRLQNRQKAYKAAQNFESTWEPEYNLISLGADYGEVEVEL